MRTGFDSFRAQIALIALAAVSTAALAVLLVRDVLLSAEERLVSEAFQQCRNAAAELRSQYAERARVAEEPLGSLPPEAIDLSLGALSSTVLRTYEGLEGGYWMASLGRASGYSAPAVSLAATAPSGVTLEMLAEAVEQLPRSLGTVELRREEGLDILTLVAYPLESGGAAWAVKRLAGARDPAGRSRRWWLAGLVISALFGVGGVISVSIRLRRGADTIGAGLQRLEGDFSYRLPAIDGEFGQIAGAINQMADRRVTLEQTLRRQDRLAALGKVVAGVAHEIRNPLNSIRLSLELLRRRVRRGEVRDDEIEGAMEEVDRLDRILARLLAFGKPSLDDRRLQPLAPLVRRAVQMVQEPAQRRRVAVEIEEPNDGAPVEAEVDGLQVEQVLINLLLNAIEASPEGEYVRICWRHNDGYLEVKVRDQGGGIPGEIREHIFDPYFTTKQEGNGLGLAVSREVAETHGGTLEFDSNGQGAEFILRLPRRKDAE